MGFDYSGRVRLTCQEGGCAEDGIELVDMPATTPPKDIIHLLVGMEGRTLSDVLDDLFRLGEPDGVGDRELGCLRITVERI